MNRENVEKLRDFLRDEVPDERFYIKNWFSRRDGDKYAFAPPGETKSVLRKDCGTAACVAGWGAAVLLPRAPYFQASEVAAKLGLGFIQGRALFTPTGHWRSPRKFTRTRAVETLTRLLETGEVDWGTA